MMRKGFLIFILMLTGSCAMLRAQLRESVQGPLNDVKVTVLSFFSGSTRVTYERVLTPYTSAELTVGLIGAGYDWMNDAAPEGVVVKVAWKWNRQNAACSYTPLQGLYLKPELIYANYDYDDKTSRDACCPSRRDHTSRWAVMAEGGWQHIWNWFLMDVYMGLGPSWGDVNTDNYYHGIMLFPKGGHLAFTAGCRFGVAF